MAKYKPQYKQEDGTTADLDLCAKYDGNGDQIDTTYAKLTDISDNSGVTELSDQYVRITDLETGIYKLTYNGAKYIYYDGTTGTGVHTVVTTYATNPVLLYVTQCYTTPTGGYTYWQWYYIAGTSSSPNIYYSSTSQNSGVTARAISLSAILTNISSYVKNHLTYSTSNTTYALSAYQGYVLKTELDNQAATISALEARIAALESGGSSSSVLYTIEGSTSGNYVNNGDSEDKIRGYLYSGEVTHITLTNSTGTDIIIGYDSGEDYTYTEYNGVQAYDRGDSLTLGTDPIDITEINVTLMNDYDSYAEHYGWVSAEEKIAEVQAVILADLPNLFTPE